MITHFMVKDKKKRILYARYEWEMRQLKAIANNLMLPAEIRFKARLEMAKLPRNSSKTRLRNRCTLTGRARGVYRFCGFSRIKIRDLVAQNKIPGLRKSSW